MKKVPVVVYEDGKRKVVGEAMVDIGDDYVSLTATVLNKYLPKFLDLNENLGPYSIGYNKIEE